MPKKYIILIGLVGVLLVYFGLTTDTFYSKKVSDFESCVAYGNPVMESYPRQCRDKDGNLYVEKIAPEKNEKIVLLEPKPDSIVKSPLRITGEALGTWFFEASFPVELVDGEGKLIKSHYAMAEGEWMTESFVPFSSTIDFSVSTETKGFLVLKKDNPSGLPEHDDEIRIPMLFVPSGSGTGQVTSECVVGGCSGELCLEPGNEEVVSICVYKEEYACLKESRCERQISGKCGWTETNAYKTCLLNLGPLTE